MHYTPQCLSQMHHALFVMVWGMAMMVPWMLALPIWIKLLIFIFALSYGLFIAWRDVWRLFSFSICSIECLPNGQWQIELKDKSKHPVSFSGDSVASASFIFLRWGRAFHPDSKKNPMYFPKSVFFSALQSKVAYRRCVLQLYEGTKIS